jgi:hypothetical protein
MPQMAKDVFMQRFIAAGRDAVKQHVPTAVAVERSERFY